jgi:hypothetical protein
MEELMESSNRKAAQKDIFTLEQVVCTFKTMTYELKKPEHPHPLVEVIFRYLNSFKTSLINPRKGKHVNGFRALSQSTQQANIRSFHNIYLNSDGFKSIKKGFFKAYFKSLISKGSSTELTYKAFNLIKVLSSNPEALGVEFCIEIKQICDELAQIKIIKGDNNPRESFTDIMGISGVNNAALAKSVYNGFNVMLGDSWKKLETLRADVKALEFDRTKLDAKSIKEIWYKIIKSDNDFLISSLLSQSDTLKDFSYSEIKILYQGHLNDDKKLISASFKKKYFTSNKSLIYKYSVRDRGRALSLPKNELSVFLLNEPLYEQVHIAWMVLARSQFSQSGLQKLKVKDIDINPNTDSLQVATIDKTRGQSQNGGRALAHQSNKGQDSYKILSDYRELMINHYVNKGLSEEEAMEQPLFQNITPVRSLGVITNCYKRSPLWKKGQNFEQIKPFIDRWSKIENVNQTLLNIFLVEKAIEKKKFSKTKTEQDAKVRLAKFKSTLKYLLKEPKFARIIGISTTNISQAEKINQFDYTISPKNLNEMEILSSGGPVEELQAALRNHSLAVDVNTYFARSRHPIMLEAEHLVQAQVGNKLLEESRILGVALAKKTTLKDIQILTGTTTQSEKINSIEGLNEFISKTNGYQLNDFFALERGSELIIIKHPVVLAVIKHYIHFLDDSLKSLDFDQTRDMDQDSSIPEKIVQTEALRVVLSVMSETQFEEPLHRKADEFISEYEMPTFKPIF